MLQALDMRSGAGYRASHCCPPFRWSKTLLEAAVRLPSLDRVVREGEGNRETVRTTGK